MKKTSGFTAINTSGKVLIPRFGMRNVTVVVLIFVHVTYITVCIARGPRTAAIEHVCKAHIVCSKNAHISVLSLSLRCRLGQRFVLCGSGLLNQKPYRLEIGPRTSPDQQAQRTRLGSEEGLPAPVGWEGPRA